MNLRHFWQKFCVISGYFWETPVIDLSGLGKGYRYWHFSFEPFMEFREVFKGSELLFRIGDYCYSYEAVTNRDLPSDHGTFRPKWWHFAHASIDGL